MYTGAGRGDRRAYGVGGRFASAGIITVGGVIARPIALTFIILLRARRGWSSFGVELLRGVDGDY